jgi:uncharacterized protein (TIGR04222 family)
VLPNPAHLPHRSFRFLAVVIVALLAASTFAAPALAFNDPYPGTRVADAADALSDQEIERIDRAIQAVGQAGAVAAVYLQLRDATVSETVDDGRALMEEWNLQSTPDARDGVVIFLNLEPDDPDHGALAIVAGEAHFDGGALPQSELDRIRNTMLDVLEEGRLAEGIVLGLEQIEARLIAGPPEPSAFEAWVTGLSRGPISWLNVIAIVAAGALALILAQVWATRPRVTRRWQEKTTRRPGDLHPAYAGALARASVEDAHIEATLLDLAHRGALFIEPVEGTEDKVRIRLNEQPEFRAPFERELWSLLEEHATNGVIEPDALPGVGAGMHEIRRTLERELIQRGLIDPQADRKRLAMNAIGIVALVLAGGALLALAVSGERWALIGVGMLAFTGVGALVLAQVFPKSTIEGERAAQPWRGFQAGLKDARRQPYGVVDLDDAFPYLVALGLASDFEPYLNEASRAGYVPGWLRTSGDGEVWHMNWVPYWAALHGSMAPATSSTGSSFGGGAATGSGASGGRF